MNVKHWLILGLVLVLVACGSPAVSTPAVTPEAIYIAYPDALQPWMDGLAKCASTNPQVAVYISQSNQFDSDQSNAITLNFGQLDDDYSDLHLSQVGWEQLVVVVNKANPLTGLSSPQLKSIFSGQTTVWEGATRSRVQVWVLPQDEPTHRIFDQLVMQGDAVTSEAMLAPDISAMLEAISENTDAIGYIPSSWIETGGADRTDKVKIIQLDTTLENNLRQPVIAITQREPSGLLRELLVCLVATTP
jgi:phosphate transport system substrate-binding protein